jgi:hypothetical protein
MLIAAEDPITGATDSGQLPSIGWMGFYDGPAIIQFIASLVLATVLGAIIAYHPMTRRAADTIEEAELPKVTIMYALVGAIVGVVVLEFGMIIGFIVFGIGGLMRFRTETASTRDTGRLIIATLIGLIAGLNFPHFAILATLFTWILVFILDARPVISLEVRDLPKDQLKAAADTYRAVLVGLGCRMFAENKGLSKGKLVFIFRPPGRATPSTLQDELNKYVPENLRGETDWSVE